MPRGPSSSRRLEIIESLAIDPRRRLLIVRRDDTEHLLLLGFNEDVVVETNINKSPAEIQTKSARNA